MGINTTVVDGNRGGDGRKLRSAQWVLFQFEPKNHESKSHAGLGGGGVQTEDVPSFESHG